MDRKMKTILALAGVGAAAALSIGILMRAKSNVAIVAECTP